MPIKTYPTPYNKQSLSKGFTLIELSIVLVIIGLITGGVLVGQDLVESAKTRAQITQIESYKTAVNIFRNKYDGLPGDLASDKAAQFGFVSRAGLIGRGDGNETMMGIFYGIGTSSASQTGEPLLFWRDLSEAGLIDGNFTSITDAAPSANITTASGSSNLDFYLPQAKLQGGNYVYVFSGPYTNNPSTIFFGVLQIKIIQTSGVGSSSTSIPVGQAYNIDKKIDDGLANNGRVQTFYLTASVNGSPSPNADPDTTSTCFNSSTGQYSLSYNKGKLPNCALSFQLK